MGLWPSVFWRLTEEVKRPWDEYVRAVQGLMFETEVPDYSFEVRGYRQRVIFNSDRNGDVGITPHIRQCFVGRRVQNIESSRVHEIIQLV
jgi:hypothetical protein